MTASLTDAHSFDDMPLKATSAEDLLSYAIYVLGYWPQESLVVISAEEKQLGPCLRMDLPESDEEWLLWIRGLEDLCAQLQRQRRWSQVFLAVFTAGTRSLDLTEDQTEGVTLCDGFLAAQIPGRALIEAAGQARAGGFEVRSLWLVDKAADRWGELEIVPPDAEEESEDIGVVLVPEEAPGGVPGHPWLIASEGTAVQIGSSSVSTALVVDGHVLDRTGPQAERQNGGQIDLVGICGTLKAAEISQRLREHLALHRRDPLREEAYAGVIEAADRGVEQLGQGSSSCRRGEPTCEDLTILDLEDMARWAVFLQGTVGLTLVLMTAGCGPRTARAFLDRLLRRERGMAGAAQEGMEFFLGTARRWPDRERLRALRILFGLLNDAGEPCDAAAASTALGFANWYLGNNSQAHDCAVRAEGLGAGYGLQVLLSLRQQRPLPRWFEMDPAQGCAGVREKRRDP